MGDVGFEPGTSASEVKLNFMYENRTGRILKKKKFPSFSYIVRIGMYTVQYMSYMFAYTKQNVEKFIKSFFFLFKGISETSPKAKDFLQI